MKFGVDTTENGLGFASGRRVFEILGPETELTAEYRVLVTNKSLDEMEAGLLRREEMWFGAEKAAATK